MCIRIFNYNDAPVSFESADGSVMVNATEMAQAFGKRTSDWLKNQSTNEFLRELSVTRNLVTADLVIVRQGGDPALQGTWMHEDAALEFARWLAPKFAIWCNDRIKELLRHGLTATAPTLEAMLGDPDLVIGMATRLKAERAAREQAQRLCAEKERQIERDAPKVRLSDDFLSAEGAVPVAQLANVMANKGVKNAKGKPVGRTTVFKWLRYIKALKDDNTPYQNHIDAGRFTVCFVPVTIGGAVYNKPVTRVTPKGVAWVLSQIPVGNRLPPMD